MLLGYDTKPVEDCTDDCRPPTVPSLFLLPNLSIPTFLFASLPFIATFTFVVVISLRRLFPYISPETRPPSTSWYRRLASTSFAITLAATAVLAQLILCEIIDVGHQKTRWLWFRSMVNLLLGLLIVVNPGLAVSSLATEPQIGARRWSGSWRYVVRGSVFAAWLWAFYKVGDHLPIPPVEEVLKWKAGSVVSKTAKGLSEECLARIGCIGVTLMAILSGFGCISAPWQAFASKPKIVNENDVRRIQGGIDATTEMLAEKQNKLASLERKIQGTSPGVMTKMMNSIRGDKDTIEICALRNEVTGLSVMQKTLISELSTTTNLLAEQIRSKTSYGRIYTVIQMAFSVYCLYRLSSTLMLRFPFPFSSSNNSPNGTSFSQKDPIGNVLAVIVKHYDPDLDRAAWSRNIGFAFSGIIIFGSVNSAATTFAMLTRAAPSVWGHTGLALAACQVTAIYVLSSAVLLRSSLPKDMGSVLGVSLGVMLDVGWVDRWFDSMFLGGAMVTVIVLIVVRRWKAAESSGWEDDLESGKRS